MHYTTLQCTNVMCAELVQCIALIQGATTAQGQHFPLHSALYCTVLHANCALCTVHCSALHCITPCSRAPARALEVYNALYCTALLIALHCTALPGTAAVDCRALHYTADDRAACCTAVHYTAPLHCSDALPVHYSSCYSSLLHTHVCVLTIGGDC
jgi:hypothetical protein